jgi:glutathionyl-hydroquinone reductase
MYCVLPAECLSRLREKTRRNGITASHGTRYIDESRSTMLKIKGGCLRFDVPLARSYQKKNPQFTVKMLVPVLFPLPQNTIITAKNSSL